MFSPRSGLLLAFLAMGVMSASIAIGNVNGKYDTEGTYKLKFAGGGGTFKGTFEGDSRIKGKGFTLDTETDSGCELTGKGKATEKIEEGRGKMQKGKFTSDCGMLGATKFSIDKGSGSVKENRKGDANSKSKAKATGKGGFAPGSTVTITTRGSD
ncbi:MAG: hypothetical protein AAGB29_12500 [Planctomycetota bacterium]